MRILQWKLENPIDIIMLSFFKDKNSYLINSKKNGIIKFSNGLILQDRDELKSDIQ